MYDLIIFALEVKPFRRFFPLSGGIETVIN
jgi:hypothetical protein